MPFSLPVAHQRQDQVRHLREVEQISLRQMVEVLADSVRVQLAEPAEHQRQDLLEVPVVQVLPPSVQVVQAKLVRRIISLEAKRNTAAEAAEARTTTDLTLTPCLPEQAVAVMVADHQQHLPTPRPLLACAVAAVAPDVPATADEPQVEVAAMAWC